MSAAKLAVVAGAIKTIKMAMEKETPGTWRYVEVDDEGKKKHFNPVLGTLYIKKSAFERAPATLTVSITPEG